MKKNRAKETIEKILKLAGIYIDGKNPWDVKVKNQEVYKRIISRGSLGAGEAYMVGWWDCKQLDELVYRLAHSNVVDEIYKDKRLIFDIITAYLFNLQTKVRAKQDVGSHYNIGNELYENMLDKLMIYSCGYWKDARSLNDAQEAKLDLICRKLDLKPNQKILDIGCGWGGFVKYAAEKYKVKAVGITLSHEQAKLAKEKCKNLPVEIRIQDYRDINEKFNHIVSIGMLEHVGYKNYREYFKLVNKNLKDEGLSLLHTIGAYKTGNSLDPWMNKYIFPNAVLPSARQLTKALEGLFIIEDWHNFGSDYDKTLMAWFSNFDKNWDKIKNISVQKKYKIAYDERFYRMWKFYLLTCAGSFRSRRSQLWQIVLSKKGVIGGYKSIR